MRLIIRNVLKALKDKELYEVRKMGEPNANWVPLSQLAPEFPGDILAAWRANVTDTSFFIRQAWVTDYEVREIKK